MADSKKSGSPSRTGGRAASAGSSARRGRPRNADVEAQIEAARQRSAEHATVTPLPDGPTDASGLTPRQRRILEVIKEAVEARGYPPSIRELGDEVGLASSSSVAHQLKVLEQK